MSESQSGFMHFTISGPGLVDIARDSVSSERWEHGVSMLRCLEDENGPLSTDTCFEILSGKKTLTGDSNVGVDIVAEDPEVSIEVQKTQDFIYGGRFFWKGKWYRPYTTVQAGTLEDGHWAYRHHHLVCGNICSVYSLKQLSATGALPASRDFGAPNAWMTARPLMYAVRPMDDLLVWVDSRTYSGGYKAYLCEFCAVPPLWRLSPQEAGGNTPHPTVEERLKQRSVPHFDGLAAKAAELRRDRELLAVQDKQPVLAAGTEERELEDRVAEAHYRQQVLDIRTQVRLQAGPIDGQGWVTLRDENTLRGWRVPKSPFKFWSLCRRFPEKAREIEWATVSPRGFKLDSDIPQHTDWLLGGVELVAGETKDLSIEKDYRDDALNAAAYDKAHDMEREAMAVEVGLSYQVLAHGPKVVGIVVHPAENESVPKDSIVILPNGRPEWSIPALSAAGVILEIGGELAHIVQLGLEQGKPVFRVPKARERWLEDVVLELDTALCSIERLP